MFISQYRHKTLNKAFSIIILLRKAK